MSEYIPVIRHSEMEGILNKKLKHLLGYVGCRIVEIISTKTIIMKIAFNKETPLAEAELEFLSTFTDVSKCVIMGDKKVFMLDTDKALDKLGMEVHEDKQRRPVTKFVKDEHTLNRKLQHLTGYEGCQILHYHDTNELQILIAFKKDIEHTEAEKEFLLNISTEMKVLRTKHVYILDVDKALVELKMRRPKKD